MANISLTDPVPGTTVVAGLHSGNNTALRTAINGGLDDTNFAAVGVANIDGKRLAGGWTTYTPVWTSSGTPIALGNGVITGSYTQIGKTIFGFLSLTMGTTTTFGTGSYLFSLPIAAVDPGSAFGLTTIVDASPANTYIYATVLATTTTVQPISLTAPGAGMTPTAPITFATSDIIVARFQYEVA